MRESLQEEICALRASVEAIGEEKEAGGERNGRWEAGEDAQREEQLAELGRRLREQADVVEQVGGGREGERGKEFHFLFFVRTRAVVL